MKLSQPSEDGIVTDTGNTFNTPTKDYLKKKKIIIFARCECKHIAHFDKTRRTPSGNPGHLTSSKKNSFNTQFMQKITTIHGVFHVCSDCYCRLYE